MNSNLKLIAAATLAILFTAPAGLAVAADEQAEHHPATDAGAAAPADAMANMQKMRAQMAAIRASKDPKERAKLMEEHLQTMQSTMQQMGQDNGCTMMGNGKGGQGGGMGMNMMQMMMDQMMQHQKAMQGMSK